MDLIEVHFRCPLEFDPAAPCYCGSSLPMQHCCLRTADTIFKMTAQVKLSQINNNHKNPKCYFNKMACCDGSISREHYIQNTVLKAISGGDFGSRGVVFMENSWLGNKKAVFVPYSRMVAKILCKFHNNSLSSLDQALGQLVRFILNLTVEFKSADSEVDHPLYNHYNKILLVNGHDIERSMAKLFAGLLYSGAFPFERMGPLAAAFKRNIEKPLTEVQHSSSAGLWIQDNKFAKGFKYNEIGVNMMLADFSSFEALVGVQLVVGLISLIYLAFEFNFVSFGEDAKKAIHRPVTFESGDSKILFSWHVPRHVLDRELHIGEMEINPERRENGTQISENLSIFLEDGKLVIDPFIGIGRLA